MEILSQHCSSEDIEGNMSLDFSPESDCSDLFVPYSNRSPDDDDDSLGLDVSFSIYKESLIDEDDEDENIKEGDGVYDDNALSDLINKLRGGNNAPDKTETFVSSDEMDETEDMTDDLIAKHLKALANTTQKKYYHDIVDDTEEMSFTSEDDDENDDSNGHEDDNSDESCSSDEEEYDSDSDDESTEGNPEYAEIEDIMKKLGLDSSNNEEIDGKRILEKITQQGLCDYAGAPQTMSGKKQWLANLAAELIAEDSGSDDESDTSDEQIYERNVQGLAKVAEQAKLLMESPQTSEPEPTVSQTSTVKKNVHPKPLPVQPAASKTAELLQKRVAEAELQAYKAEMARRQAEMKTKNHVVNSPTTTTCSLPPEKPQGESLLDAVKRVKESRKAQPQWDVYRQNCVIPRVQPKKDTINNTTPVQTTKIETSEFTKNNNNKIQEKAQTDGIATASKKLDEKPSTMDSSNSQPDKFNTVEAKETEETKKEEKYVSNIEMKSKVTVVSEGPRKPSTNAKKTEEKTGSVEIVESKREVKRNNPVIDSESGRKHTSISPRDELQATNIKNAADKMKKEKDELSREVKSVNTLKTPESPRKSNKTMTTPDVLSEKEQNMKRKTHSKKAKKSKRRPSSNLTELIKTATIECSQHGNTSKKMNITIPPGFPPYPGYGPKWPWHPDSPRAPEGYRECYMKHLGEFYLQYMDYLQKRSSVGPKKSTTKTEAALRSSLSIHADFKKKKPLKEIKKKPALAPTTFASQPGRARKNCAVPVKLAKIEEGSNSSSKGSKKRSTKTQTLAKENLNVGKVHHKSKGKRGKIVVVSGKELEKKAKEEKKNKKIAQKQSNHITQTPATASPRKESNTSQSSVASESSSSHSSGKKAIRQHDNPATSLSKKITPAPAVNTKQSPFPEQPQTVAAEQGCACTIM